MNSRRKTIFSIVLAAALIITSVIVYLLIEFTRDPGGFVRISVDGTAVSEHPLDTDGEYEIGGGTNILVIKDGKAYMKYATCPDGLCKNQGKIHLSGERIVCLPNRVLVEVFANGDEIIPN